MVLRSRDSGGDVSRGGEEGLRVPVFVASAPLLVRCRVKRELTGRELVGAPA